MTAQATNQRDTRLYFVNRDGRIVKKFWHQMSDAERASELEAQQRAAYNDLFDIY